MLVGRPSRQFFVLDKSLDQSYGLQSGGLFASFKLGEWTRTGGHLACSRHFEHGGEIGNPSAGGGEEQAYSRLCPCQVITQAQGIKEKAKTRKDCGQPCTSEIS